MKQITKLLPVLLVILGLSTTAWAQVVESDEQTVSSYAELVQQIQSQTGITNPGNGGLDTDGDIDFGLVSNIPDNTKTLTFSSTGGGALVVDGGTTSENPLGDEINGGASFYFQSGHPIQATFTSTHLELDGDPSETLTYSFIEDSGAYSLADSDDLENSTAYESFYPDGPLSLDDSVVEADHNVIFIAIGGQVEVDADQADGEYSGTVTISLAYL